VRLTFGERHRVNGTALFRAEQLFDFTLRVFQHLGVPEDDARTAATVLQAADLRGIDSHGVARLHSYFDMLRLGRIDPRANVRVVRESPSTTTIDGGNGPDAALPSGARQRRPSPRLVKPGRRSSTCWAGRG
jgi:LDH2 family malate/lactate/ureidoglycolate dehydrogenase